LYLGFFEFIRDIRGRDKCFWGVAHRPLDRPSLQSIMSQSAMAWRLGMQ
jgi:hypothetical protein